MYSTIEIIKVDIYPSLGCRMVYNIIYTILHLDALGISLTLLIVTYPPQIQLLAYSECIRNQQTPIPVCRFLQQPLGPVIHLEKDPL